MIQRSRRLGNIPPYPFAKLEAALEAARSRGEDVVNLGIGDPDLPPPSAVIEAARDAMKRQDMRGYGSSDGERFFKRAVSDWYARRFGVEIDSDSEVCCLIGSKEGLANLARAYVDSGTRVLCPDPGYPVYSTGATLLCDGRPSLATLSPPDFRLDPGVLDSADSQVAFLNYPSNPTGATTSLKDLGAYVERARERDILLCHDFAYSELAFDPEDAPSIMQVEGAKECAVEFHSLSKTFSMTGFRLGMAVGNAEAIASLKRVKAQLDSGPPKFLQWAGATALGLYRSANRPREVSEAVEAYRRRLALLVNGLSKLGHSVRTPRAAFYLWHRVAKDGLSFAQSLLEKNVLVTPGEAFGPGGKRYVRWAVTQPEERIRTALERMDV